MIHNQALVHKTKDWELQIAGKRYIWDLGVLIITETWLNQRICNASMQLAGPQGLTILDL